MPPTSQGRTISMRATTKLATSAIVSTAAIESDATIHVEPHNNANWMIDFVSSSMKPAPSRKKCHENRPGSPRSVAITATSEITSTTASAFR